MEEKLSFLYFSILSVFVACSNSHLTSAPKYLKSCKINEPNFQQCSTESIQGLIRQWNTGIPGLKAVGTLEPLSVNKIKLAQNTGSGTINVQLANIAIKGFGNTVVKESKVNPKDYNWNTKFFVPKLRLDSDYKVKGRILVLNLNGQGKMFLETDNSEFIINSKTHLYDKDGFTFCNVTSVHVDMKIGGFRTKFENLFNGNKELEDSTNLLFNENWQDFFEVLRPAITETVRAILLDRYKKIFDYIPANYFISDIPSAKIFYNN